jgi:hypothetical protein
VLTIFFLNKSGICIWDYELPARKSRADQGARRPGVLSTNVQTGVGVVVGVFVSLWRCVLRIETDTKKNNKGQMK